MNDIDELDRLHAAATAGEWVVRSYQEPSGEWAPAPSWETYGEDNLTLTAALHNAWPGISARLRAAEVDAANLRVMLGRALDEHRVEVERLRRLCRVAAARIDDDALALAELLDDQDAPVDGGALADALSRAALGEP